MTGAGPSHRQPVERQDVHGRALSRFAAAVERVLGDVDFEVTERRPCDRPGAPRRPRGSRDDRRGGRRRHAERGRQRRHAGPPGRGGAAAPLTAGRVSGSSAWAPAATSVAASAIGRRSTTTSPCSPATDARRGLLRVGFVDHAGQPASATSSTCFRPARRPRRSLRREDPAPRRWSPVVRPGVGVALTPVPAPSALRLIGLVGYDRRGRRARGVTYLWGSATARSSWRHALAPAAVPTTPARRRVHRPDSKWSVAATAQGLPRPPLSVPGASCCAAAASRSSCSTRRGDRFALDVDGERWAAALRAELVPGRWRCCSRAGRGPEA